jgi:hypothetical protein
MQLLYPKYYAIYGETVCLNKEQTKKQSLISIIHLHMITMYQSLKGQKCEIFSLNGFR